MEQITLNHGRDVYVPLKLKKEWMGHPKGAQLTLIRSQAEVLIKRGTAKSMLEKDQGVVEKVFQRRRRNLSGPPKDKMIHGAEKTK